MKENARRNAAQLAILGVLGALLMVPAPGCNWLRPARQEMAAAPEAATSQDTSLQIRVVRAGAGDDSIPDRAFDLSAPRSADRWLEKKNVIIFQDNIYLPDRAHPGTVFLVWPDAWGDSKIQGVLVEHRLEDEHGQFTGPASRHVPLFDVPSGRWYLPVEAFCSNRSPCAEPSRQQQLFFDLWMSDGGRRMIEVRLRVIGEAPRLRLETLEVADPKNPDLQSELLKAWDEGLVVRSSRLSNPAPRPTRAWIRADHPARLELRYLAGKLTYGNDPRDVVENSRKPPQYAFFQYPPLPNPIGWEARAESLELIGVHVVREPGPRSGDETRAIEPGRQIDVLLGAGESVTLRWIARVLTGSARPEFPSAETRSFWWCRDQCVMCHITVPGAVKADCEHLKERTQVLEAWRVGGYAVEGGWNESIGSTHPWEMILDPELLETSEVSASISIGIR